MLKKNNPKSIISMVLKIVMGSEDKGKKIQAIAPSLLPTFILRS